MKSGRMKVVLAIFALAGSPQYSDAVNLRHVVRRQGEPAPVFAQDDEHWTPGAAAASVETSERQAEFRATSNGICMYALPAKFNLGLLDSTFSQPEPEPKAIFLGFDNPALEGMFDTNQFSLERIFYDRMIVAASQRLPADKCKMFYVPYFAAWETSAVNGRWLNVNRPQLERELLKHVTHLSVGAVDHFVVVGRISSNVRPFLENQAFRSMVKLVIEDHNPGMYPNIHAIPYPTWFRYTPMIEAHSVSKSASATANISVTEASFGESCFDSNASDFREAVAVACNGKVSCGYRIPQACPRGCRSCELKGRFSCGDGWSHSFSSLRGEKAEGEAVVLSCQRGPCWISGDCPDSRGIAAAVETSTVPLRRHGVETSTVPLTRGGSTDTETAAQKNNEDDESIEKAQNATSDEAVVSRDSEAAEVAYPKDATEDTLTRDSAAKTQTTSKSAEVVAAKDADIGPTPRMNASGSGDDVLTRIKDAYGCLKAKRKKSMEQDTGNKSESLAPAGDNMFKRLARRKKAAKALREKQVDGHESEKSPAAAAKSNSSGNATRMQQPNVASKDQGSKGETKDSVATPSPIHAGGRVDRLAKSLKAGAASADDKGASADGDEKIDKLLNAVKDWSPASISLAADGSKPSRATGSVLIDVSAAKYTNRTGPLVSIIGSAYYHEYDRVAVLNMCKERPEQCSVFNTGERTNSSSSLMTRVPGMYQVVMASTFCINAPGDSATRKGLFDSLVLGCIPVVTSEDSLQHYRWHLPNWRNVSVLVTTDQVFEKGFNIVDHLAELEAKQPGEIRRKQALIQEMAYSLQYSVTPADASRQRGPDAFDLTLEYLLEEKTRTHAPPKLRHSGTFAIVNAASGKRLFAQGSGMDRTLGVGATKRWRGGEDQEWKFEGEGDGDCCYTITNVASSRSLYAESGGAFNLGAARPGTMPSEGTFWHMGDRTWRLDDQGNGTFNIVGVGSGRRLFAHSHKFGGIGATTGWPGSEDQKWLLVSSTEKF